MRDSDAKLTESFHDAQRVFRSALKVLTRPGMIENLPLDGAVPPPLNGATAAILMALLEEDAPLWVQERNPAVSRYLQEQCHAILVDGMESSVCAVVTAPLALPGLGSWSWGSARFADRSPTLIIQVDDFQIDQGCLLLGPGMLDSARLAVQGLSSTFWAEREAQPPWNRADLLLTAGDRVTGVPRSTRLGR